MSECRHSDAGPCDACVERIAVREPRPFVAYRAVPLLTECLDCGERLIYCDECDAGFCGECGSGQRGGDFDGAAFPAMCPACLGGCETCAGQKSVVLGHVHDPNATITPCPDCSERQ